MLSRAVLSLVKSNKLSLLAKRSLHDTIYIAAPPKNYISPMVSLVHLDLMSIISFNFSFRN